MRVGGNVPVNATFDQCKGVRKTLRSLQDRFEFHVVTSRQLAIQESTQRWIESFYPGIFESVQFGNHYGRQGAKRYSNSLTVTFAR